MLKCNINHDDDDKLKELKVKLNQYEETYKINVSKLNVSNDNKYIRDCNYYSLKTAKLKGIIKLKSKLTDDDEIVIEKKSVATKVNEKRIQDYLIDEIEVLKGMVTFSIEISEIWEEFTGWSSSEDDHGLAL